jgi:hypothetical protein
MPVLAIGGDAGFRRAGGTRPREPSRTTCRAWSSHLFQDEILGDDRIAISMKTCTGLKLADGGTSGLAVQAMS